MRRVIFGLLTAAVLVSTYARPAGAASALEIGTVKPCGTEFFWVAPTLATVYVVPGMGGTGIFYSTASAARGRYPTTATLFGLTCGALGELPAGGTLTVDFEKATAAGLTYGNDAVPTGGTWSNTGSPSCAITGTSSGLQAEAECSDATTALAVAKTERVHARVQTAGTWAGGKQVWCSWWVCLEHATELVK